MEHTDGPWKTDGLNVTSRLGIICRCILPQDGGTFAAMDNSYLIAATPDLLKSLKTLWNDYKGQTPTVVLCTWCDASAPDWGELEHDHDCPFVILNNLT